MKIIDDKVWINAVKKGDKSVFKTFYITQKNPFLAWAVKQFAYSQSELEDLYQQSMLILYENITAGKLDELSSSVKTYLYGISKNLVLSRQKKEKIVQSHQKKVSEHLNAQAQQAETEEEQQLKNLVKELMPLMKDPCGRILACFYFEGRKIEDIAQLLNYKSKEVVKVQKSRCMQYLKKMMLEKLAAQEANKQ